MIREPINGECEFCDAGPMAELVLVGEYEEHIGEDNIIWLPMYACHACLAEFKSRNDDVSLIELLRDIEI